jgi:hypothetical protein
MLKTSTLRLQHVYPGRQRTAFVRRNSVEVPVVTAGATPGRKPIPFRKGGAYDYAALLR